VYGNAPLANTTHNTLSILTALNRTSIPVYAGVSAPLVRNVIHAADIHGESGLDGTTLLPSPTMGVRNDVSAIEAAYRALSATEPGTSWLVATGAMTNAALLFATYPDLAEHLAGVAIMGGAVGGNFTGADLGVPPSQVTENGTAARAPVERMGNITPFAEFNFYIDPEVAQALFSNPVLAEKITLVTLDLTHLFLATPSVRQHLLQPSGTGDPPSKVRRLFAEILDFFAKTYAEVFDITAGPPVHDPLAVAAACHPELFLDDPDDADRKLRYQVDIVTEGAHRADEGISAREVLGSQCGRSVVTLLPEGKEGVRIPRAVNAEAIWTLLGGGLENCDREVGAIRAT